jgi:hypothetical protein
MGYIYIYTKNNGRSSVMEGHGVSELYSKTRNNSVTGLLKFCVMPTTKYV